MAFNFKKRFRLWLARRTEHCKAVAPLFSAAFDRRLSLREKLRVRLHLFTCGACLNYVSNLKFMHEVFRAREDAFGREKLHASLSPEAAERIKNALKSAE